jgi:hypothetical protein
VAPDGDVVADGDVPIDVGVDCDGIVVTIEEVAAASPEEVDGTGVVLDSPGGDAVIGATAAGLLPTWESARLTICHVSTVVTTRAVTHAAASLQEIILRLSQRTEHRGFNGLSRFSQGGSPRPGSL